jgi:hypothetical protein
MCFSTLFSTAYTIASTSDVTTLLLNGSNVIIQVVGYSKNSPISLSLTGSYTNCRPWRYLIYQLKKIVSPHVSRIVYFTCFHSHLRYGITIWGNDRHSSKIFMLQKKVIRLICNISRQTSCRNFFKALRILPLPCVYTYEMVCWMKFQQGKLNSNADIHEHDTRNKNDLHRLTTRTNMAKLNGVNRGIILYNKLPSHLKKINRKHEFKCCMKQFLLQYVFYSVEEYLNMKF